MLVKAVVLASLLGVFWSTTTSADVTNPDVRVAVDFYPIQQAVRQFQYYKLGQWMQFGEFKCGDRNVFWLFVREPPYLGLQRYSDGTLPGTTIKGALDVRAELN